MNEIKVFDNNLFGSIRVTQHNNEPYFIGTDIAKALGYSNPRKAIIDHVDNEDRATVTICDGRQNRNLTGINESGLYSLIFGSKLPSAKEFKRWVTSEI